MLKILSAAVAAFALLQPTAATARVSADKPFAVPEIRNWQASKTADATFTPDAATAIVCADGVAVELADTFAAEYKALTGLQPGVSSGRAPKANYISLRLKANKKLPAEGYEIDITPKGINVTAPTAEGLRWATKTLLQLTEASASLPCGRISDWPDYGFRGLVIDCGRKYIPLSYLYKLVDVLAYYKMNVLHIHLNDNGFKVFYDNDWDKTQAAFRLESELFPELTARDGSYSKQEFRDFQRYAMSKGVEIVPEIDFPAHSLAFTRIRPEIGSTNEEYGCDHLNLMNPATYEFLDSLLGEYIGGDNPVFIGPRFHIGTDEYSNRDSAVVEKFRELTDRYIRFTEEHGKKPLVWGALTHARGKQPVKVDNVEMYCWYNGYADPDSMISLGYDVVSIPDGMVYIVPAAGYYYDYLNTPMLYDRWAPNVIGKQEFEPRHPQIKGGAFAVWNDHPDNGITVKDIHHRIMEALPTMALKNWNGDKPRRPFAEFDSLRHNLSEAPGVNLRAIHKPDASGVVFQAAEVKPLTTLPIAETGYGSVIEFDIEGGGDQTGTKLFESPDAVFWLSDPITGNMAFSHEGELRSFRYAPRKGERAHIRVECDDDATLLYVNGKLVDNLSRRWFGYADGKKRKAQVSTLVFPLQQSGNFSSRIKNLKVTRKN